MAIAANTLLVPYCLDCDKVADNPPALAIKGWGGLIGIVASMDFFGWTVEYVFSKVPTDRRALMAAHIESYAAFLLAHGTHHICLRSADGNSVVEWPVVDIRRDVRHG